MVADDTYFTKTYKEREGNRYVANSGGTFAVESGGSTAVYSGAQVTVESGANFEVAGGDIAGADLRRVLIYDQLQDSQVPAALGTALAVSNLPADAGTFVIYGSATLVSSSFWMTSVSAGRVVTLCLFGDSTGTLTNNKTQVDVSTSGCIMLGSIGGFISRFEMNTSAASDCMITLMAVLDNTWAIIDERGDIDERVNA